ncbi:MAG: tetratricopeptide repeat protein [Pseudomonadota bacterium]
MGLFNRFTSRRPKTLLGFNNPPSDTKALELIEQGHQLEDAGKLDEALALYLAAIETSPNLPKAHLNYGNVLLAKGDATSALASYAKALEFDPNYASAHYNCGNAQVALLQYAGAISCYKKALAANPSFVDAWVALGYAQHHAEEYAAAKISYSRALQLQPNYPEALNNLGLTHISLSEYDDALACFCRSIELKPDYDAPYYHRSLLHIARKDRTAAIKDLDHLLSIRPTYSLALGQRLHTKMHLCDWDDYESQCQKLLEYLEQGVLVTSGFPVLAITDSARHQLMSNVLWSAHKYPAKNVLSDIQRSEKRSKIRVGYFSMDFNNHPVSFLTAGVYEAHARDEFEIYAFYFGPAVRDEMRIRLEKTFDHFVEVSGKSALEIARLSRHLEIDIAVDLAGHTGDAQTGIFALRAAPIQVNYLGYPASMGADYMDYMLVDHFTVPDDQRPNYFEKLVFLPFFQANDACRIEPVRKFSRADLGLPENAFVFCCFNHSYKITPPVFSCWMRILHQVPDSVLFLYADNNLTADNLRTEAMRAGLDPQRLIFGARLSFVDNLSRYLEADLFLDTFPFNAGTTASDALWAGLPLLTCSGKAFASRMAGSLLLALGLPELLSSDLESYEKQAVILAKHPTLLADLRQRIQQKRRGSVLSDSKAFTRHLEQAYRLMMERLDADLKPADLDLAPS